MVVTLDMMQTVALAVVVLLFGKFLCAHVGFLTRFCIPAPVVGGLLFSIATLIGHQTGLFYFHMDMVLKDFFMYFFFTTVGFTASLKLLKKGGLQVFMFLGIAIALVVLQDVVGVALASLFNLHPFLGLATASVPMTGGHGTSAAFGPQFEAAGAVGAEAVALASATFGLVAGSMIGGPIARGLIERRKLGVAVAPALARATGKSEAYTAAELEEQSEGAKLPASSIFSAFFTVCIAMGIGSIVSFFINGGPLTFPGYIGAMFVAAIFRNIGDKSKKLDLALDGIAALGDLFLTVFLAMALMSLELWQLIDLAGPMVVMLLAQVALMAFFAIFITFNVMGRDYDAAVMTSGHCGFGMGATPNAMANMKALTDKYTHSEKAFFILPIVGSLFIDLCNGGIITIFMNIFPG